jgi:Tfp pilus assembly protein PilX
VPVTAPPTLAPLHCSRCGARIDAPTELAATTARCGFCGVDTPLPIEWLQARASHAERFQAMQLQKSLQDERRESKRQNRKVLVKLVLFVVVLPAVLGLVGFLGLMFYAMTKVDAQQERALAAATALVRQHSEQVRTDHIEVSSATTCKGSTHDTVRGLVRSRVAYRLEDDCDLTFDGCTFDGQVLFEASGNARLTLRGGSYTATGPVVVARDHAVVVVDRGAKLKGEATITAMGQARAEIADATIEGGAVAILTEGNASVRRRAGSTVRGRVVGGAP